MKNEKLSLQETLSKQFDEAVASLQSTPLGPICHGRVPETNFQKMVSTKWWETVFGDELYLKTDGDVVEDPEITKEEIK
jgi:hypothetical protein